MMIGNRFEIETPLGSGGMGIVVGTKLKLAIELNDEERRILAGAMTLRDLKRGEVLVQEGTADDHL